MKSYVFWDTVRSKITDVLYRYIASIFRVEKAEHEISMNQIPGLHGIISDKLIRVKHCNSDASIFRVEN
jgi:hypothetical protein